MVDYHKYRDLGASPPVESGAGSGWAAVLPSTWRKTVISGSLVTNDNTDFGPTQTFSGGYFALPNNVIGPGNQINRIVNTSQSTSYTQDPTAQLQGAAQPTFKFQSSDFWVQGINPGLAFRF